MSSVPNNVGGNSNMGPPPNQQPRPPPPGANTHRKSSSLNRGWFEGTKELISGMAPRPVTPSQHQILKSASAPNSPARGLGLGMFGSGRNSPHHHFPPQIDRTNSGGSVGGGSGINLPSFSNTINRLPSQDSLDRSIHNESGHGKSTAQIIKDLKHSNSALTARMASQDKHHMNEMAQVQKAATSRINKLDLTNSKQKMKLMQYENYKAAAESKMKQQDAELTKVKEESAFQRHTISGLKNELYQLQQRLDEQEEEYGRRSSNDDVVVVDDHELRRPHSGDGRNLPLHPSHSRSNSGGSLGLVPTSSSVSTEELQQMSLDNEELVKEIQELQDQLMEYQGYDKKLKDLQQKLESAQRNANGNDAGIPPRPTTPTHALQKNQPERERPPLAPSKSRDQEELQQLQDARGEIEVQKQKLLQRESAVRDLEAEKEALIIANEQRVQELEDRYLDLEEEFKEREMELKKELASSSQESADEIAVRVREEQQVQIVELEEQLEQYAEKLAEVAATLAESRQQAKNQEQYRKDEAEDLRMIQDAHEAEIARLEKELDEARRELEVRDDELEETKQKHMALLQQQEKEDEKKVEETEAKVSTTKADTEQPCDGTTNLISSLEEELYSSANTVNALEQQLEDLRKERDETVAILQAENDKLLGNATGTDKSHDSDGSDLHQLWEAKTSKTKEVESLKNEIEDLRHRVQENAETARVAEMKAQDMEKKLKENQSGRAANESDSNELEEKLKLAQSQVFDSHEEIAILKEKLEESRSLSFENDKKQDALREAQVALLSLDDEKQALCDELHALKYSMEQEKAVLQNETKAQLEMKDRELAELQSVNARIGPLEDEKLRLEEEVKQLKERNSFSEDNSASVSSRSVRNKDEGSQKDLELQIEELKEERNLINSKLKDRDTTIATLLRSSIVLEKKIEALDTELRESRKIQGKALDDVKELRSIASTHQEDYSKVCEEVKYMKGQLKIAKADAKRWKRSLQDDGRPSSEYRYQISMLQKANEKFAETVQERDQAIQNLVNQSMGHDKHVRDLKIRISSLMKEVESVRMNKGRGDESALRAELDRLQEESEIFAGQIIEQDEEFKRMQRVMKNRDEQISSMKSKIEQMQENTIPDRSAIQERDRVISELQKKIQILEKQQTESTNDIDPIAMKNLQAELDEMQEAAESNRVELRDLRQQLWDAKDAAGSAHDLRIELKQARWEFDEYKRNISSEQLSGNQNGLQADLDKAISRIEELEVIISDNQGMETKLNELENELQARDIIIKELREQLSNAFSSGEVSSSGLDKKSDGLEAELQLKVEEVERLNQKLSASLIEVGEVRDLLQSKTDMVTDLNEQVKGLKVEISETQGQLRASASKAENQSKALQEAEASREVIEAKIESVNSLTKEVGALQRDAEDLRVLVKEKTVRIEQLEYDVTVLTRDINDSEKQLQMKTNAICDLQERLRTNEAQLKEASDLKLKLGSDLADSQARLGALEKELSNAITETSSNEELARKNQSLVQENASLAQKNKSLVEENASIEITNGSLMEESETLTNDNQVLCLELQALGEKNHSLSQAKDSLQHDVGSLKIEKQSLEKQNESISRENEELGERVTSLSENVVELNRCNDSLREEVRSISTIKEELATLSKANNLLTEEKRSLVEENNALTETVGSLKEKNISLSENGVKMEKEIEALKADMEMLSEGSSKLEGMKTQLQEEQRQREEVEKAIIANYEKQLSLLSSSKDLEMDSLRNSLTESREKHSEAIEDMIEQLKSMEHENGDMREQFEFEMEAKNQQIFALEHTLHAQEQIVDTMRSEMDQIQSGMEHATKARRGEVEEIQQEVMQMEEKAMKQEREIVALKMQLEERKLEHKADVVKLKDALAKAMEQDFPLKQTIHDLQNNDRMLEVRERLEQLKKRNTDLQEENLNLGGRLERAAIQINAFDLEKQQTEEIEEENMKLRKQLKEYEQLLSLSAKSSRSTSAPQSSTSQKEMTMKTKEKKKKKFGLFKRRGVDGPISEVIEEDEC